MTVHADKLFTNAIVLTMDEKYSMYEPGAVAVKGNSIIPCPIAIIIPACGVSLPLPIVIAVIGPGAITPDNEINVTSIKKENKDKEFSMIRNIDYFLFNSNYLYDG